MISTALAALLLALASSPPAPQEQASDDCVVTDDGMTVTCRKPSEMSEVLAFASGATWPGCGLAEIGLDMKRSGGYTGPFVTISKDCKSRCDLAEFARAAVAAEACLRVDMNPKLVSIEQHQWKNGEELARCYSSAVELSKQVENCAWMSEPGAFER